MQTVALSVVAPSPLICVMLFTMFISGRSIRALYNLNQNVSVREETCYS